MSSRDSSVGTKLRPRLFWMPRVAVPGARVAATPSLTCAVLVPALSRLPLPHWPPASPHCSLSALCAAAANLSSPFLAPLSLALYARSLPSSPLLLLLKGSRRYCPCRTAAEVAEMGNHFTKKGKGKDEGRGIRRTPQPKHACDAALELSRFLTQRCVQLFLLSRRCGRARHAQ